MNALKLLLAVALIIGWAAPAHALLLESTGSTAGDPAQPTYQVTITQSDVGESFDMSWLLESGAVPYDLQAEASFTIDAFSDAELLLSISIQNLTDTGGQGPAGISSFGFGTTPDVTASFVSAGTTFDGIGSGSGGQQSFPGGFKQIDVCVFAQGCSGGGQGGLLAAGASDSFVIALSGDFSSGQTAILADFPLKFQTDFGSYELAGTPLDPVPEPSSYVLFAFGAAVVGRAVQRSLRNSQ